ncbi:MAG: class I SAM-dependent methyltransferase [Alphaproteobacteria bacterium]|nr:class I SAM-dependent methyltransferase [Alphaproteobacteria bacterium]
MDLQRFMRAGGTYLEWYARRQDSFAIHQTSEDELLQRHLADRGERDLEFLVKLGLEPHHHLHEIGVGYGRSSRWLVGYLDAGHYSGNDPSAGRLEVARQHFLTSGVADKNPTLICNSNNDMDWLNGRKVDYVFCHHVTGHLPPEDVETIFKNLHHMMHEKTIMFFSYTERTDKAITRESVKTWTQNLEFYRSIADKAGLDLLDVEEIVPGLTQVATIAEEKVDTGGLWHTRIIRATLRPA